MWRRRSGFTKRPFSSALAIPSSGIVISGRVHLVQSRTEEALVWLKKARSEFQGHPLVHAFLASAYALKGATERAAVELAEARKHSGDDRYSTIARLMTLGYWGVPKVRALFEATYLAGLRKAGMPEE